MCNGVRSGVDDGGNPDREVPSMTAAECDHADRERAVGGGHVMLMAVAVCRAGSVLRKNSRAMCGHIGRRRVL